MQYYSKVDLLTQDPDRFYEAQEYGRGIIYTFHMPGDVEKMKVLDNRK